SQRRERWIGSPRRSQPPPQPLIERRRRVDTHARDYRHARAQRDVRRRIVHDDLDPHALDDLDVVSGGGLGRQQGDRGAGSGLNAVDMTADRAFWIGVDREFDRLAGPHAVELDLLEVRRDPDLIRNEHCQVRSGWANWPTAALRLTTRPGWA